MIIAFFNEILCQSLCDFAEGLGMHVHKKVFRYFSLPLKVKRGEIESELGICFTSQDYSCCPFQFFFFSFQFPFGLSTVWLH